VHCEAAGSFLDLAPGFGRGHASFRLPQSIFVVSSPPPREAFRRFPKRYPHPRALFWHWMGTLEAGRQRAWQSWKRQNAARQKALWRFCHHYYWARCRVPALREQFEAAGGTSLTASDPNRGWSGRMLWEGRRHGLCEVVINLHHHHKMGKGGFPVVEGHDHRIS
jgi:hypothetical protein